MTLQFSKYQASGNDFVMIDNRNNETHLNKEQIQWLCNRHFAVGADGIILLQKTENKDYAFEMKFYNPDGSFGMFCGNGGRCIVAFARDTGLILERCCFIAPDGKHSAEIQNDIVRLSMTEPSPPKQFADGWLIDTGTQHFVKFVDNADSVNVCKEGRALRFDSSFKDIGGTNASFVQVLPNGLLIRTYERGVEVETLSCGTAVTAAAVIHSIINGLSGDAEVKARTRGGNLKVYLHREDDKINNVFLEGEAIKVFDGRIYNYADKV
jgi:diaminopimelate epimerase